MLDKRQEGCRKMEVNNTTFKSAFTRWGEGPVGKAKEIRSGDKRKALGEK